jgi:nucleoid-associated protein YgaU
MAPRARLVAHLLLATATVAGLLFVQPAFDRSVLAQGDELGVAVAWCAALAAGVWLVVTTGACLLAVSSARPALARRTARYSLPGVQRLVEVAIASSCIALPALPAAATPAPPSPYSVFVRDEPVVRAPTSTPTSTPLSTRPASPTSSPQPVAPPNTSAERSATAPNDDEPTGTPDRRPARTEAPQLRPVPARAYVVQSGDNLWRIARVTLADADGRLTDRDVARYWRAVIDANRSTLRSGDPSLIYPGEIVSLPPVK